VKPLTNRYLRAVTIYRHSNKIIRKCGEALVAETQTIVDSNGFNYFQFHLKLDVFYRIKNLNVNITVPNMSTSTKLVSVDYQVFGRVQGKNP